MKVTSVFIRRIAVALLLLIAIAMEGSCASPRLGAVSSHAIPSSAMDETHPTRPAIGKSVPTTKRRRVDSGQHSRPVVMKRGESPRINTTLPDQNQAADTSEKKVLAFYFPQYHEVRGLQRFYDKIKIVCSAACFPIELHTSSC